MGDSGEAPEHFPTPSTKHQMIEFGEFGRRMEEWCRIPPIEFHLLFKCMQKFIEAVCND
jgi:hypothetical protein